MASPSPSPALLTRQAVGLPESHFAGHSFCIVAVAVVAAATAAAVNAGIEDFTICTLGMWSSSAFLTYIRMHPQRAIN